MTLGIYEGFPTNIHHIARFAASASEKKTQQILLETLEKLNTEAFRLETIADPSIPNCTTRLEFGIAEACSFNYLDADEAQRALKMISAQPFQIMDFMCAACYYRMEGNKKTSLRFDYFMLRFTFEERQAEIRVCHERGPRYLSPEDIVKLVIGKVNATSTKKILKTIES
jgi:hypothetical protein